MKDSSYLRGHRFFRDLKPAELENLAGLFSVLSCRAGACPIPEGSPVEGFYLVESGVLKGKNDKGEETLYACGEILGEGALFSPYAAPGPVFAVEDCRLLYLDREDYLLWRDRKSRAVRRLALPGKSAPSLSPSVLKENRLFWLAKTLPSLFFPPLLIIRLMLRRRNGTYVEGDRLIFRYFRWKSFKNTNLTIPLEQIQSVETLQKGLISRLTGTGNLLVRVNGTAGHVLVKNIPRPQKEQDRILALKRRTEEAVQARKHQRIRRDIARWVRKEEGVTLLEKGGRDRGKNAPGGAVFGKSFFVLTGIIWWQFFLAAGCGALYCWGKSSDAEWVLLPLFSLVCFLALMVYHGVDWANDLFKVQGGLLLDVNRKPLGKEKKRRQAELTAIQNVISEQKGLWANLFDYGDIRIIVPGSEGGILWEGIRNPGKAQERILRERRAWIESLEEKERLSQQEDLMLYCRFISQELSQKNRS